MKKFLLLSFALLLSACQNITYPEFIPEKPEKGKSIIYIYSDNYGKMTDGREIFDFSEQTSEKIYKKYLVASYPRFFWNPNDKDIFYKLDIQNDDVYYLKRDASYKIKQVFYEQAKNELSKRVNK